LLVTIVGLIGSIEGIISAKLGWETLLLSYFCQLTTAIIYYVGRRDYYASCFPFLS
jgi:hypothetical protein